MHPHIRRCVLASFAGWLSAACGTSGTGLLADAIAGPSPDAGAMDAVGVPDIGSDQDASPPDVPALPVSCSGIPETTCIMTMGCKALYCDACGQRFFVACALEMTGPPVCPAVCPACARNADEATCRANAPACHPVYKDPGTCDCATP